MTRRLYPLLILLTVTLGPVWAQSKDLPWKVQREAELARTRQQRTEILGRLYRPVRRQPYRPAPSGSLRVVAHRYYDHYEESFVPVRSIQVFGNSQESYHLGELVWNPGQLFQVENIIPQVPEGASFRVVVTWEDGNTRTWDYQVGTTERRVDVYRPF